jgi:acetyltransferase-like isoleucine patch superfamily enzyme
VRLVADVEVEAGVTIDANSVVYGPVRVGVGTYVGPGCVIGFPESSELADLTHKPNPSRRKLTTLGRGCVVRSGATIYSNVSVADNVSFGHNVVVREGVTIGRGTKVGTGVVIDGTSRIGANVSIQTGVYICTYSTVEDCVFLGPKCVFTNDKYVMQKPVKLVGPTVKKGASVGANAILFPAITVGEGAVVGSQAMVNSNVPARSIFAGSPAKKLRSVPKDWRSTLLSK